MARSRKKTSRNLKLGLLLFLSMLMAVNVIGQVLSKIPTSGKTIKDFIPKGYDTLAVAKGDLNKDKRDDLVLVLRPDWELSEIEITEDSARMEPRLLIVLLNSGEGFKVAGKSQGAVLCESCGGVFGDPFSGIEINNGVLLIHHYGGSSWRWSSTHKFRYQQTEFVLIGETKSSYSNVEHCDELGDFLGTNYKDINFVTGDYEEKKIASDKCKLLVNKKGKMVKMPLQKLNTFNLEN